MDIRKVKKLIELLDESGIAEIEITEGEDSVRISRYAQSVPVAAAAPAPVATSAPGAAPEHTAAAEAPTPAPAAAEPEEEGFIVTAPMVGTFYSAPSPGAPAYVQVGDRVMATLIGGAYAEYAVVLPALEVAGGIGLATARRFSQLKVDWIPAVAPVETPVDVTFVDGAGEPGRRSPAR